LWAGPGEFPLGRGKKNGKERKWGGAQAGQALHGLTWPEAMQRTHARTIRSCRSPRDYAGADTGGKERAVAGDSPAWHAGRRRRSSGGAVAGLGRRRAPQQLLLLARLLFPVALRSQQRPGNGDDNDSRRTWTGRADDGEHTGAEREGEGRQGWTPSSTPPDGGHGRVITSACCSKGAPWVCAAGVLGWERRGVRGWKVGRGEQRARVPFLYPNVGVW
jgi:hypothetical protein